MGRFFIDKLKHLCRHSGYKHGVQVSHVAYFGAIAIDAHTAHAALAAGLFLALAVGLIFGGDTDL